MTAHLVEFYVVCDRCGLLAYEQDLDEDGAFMCPRCDSTAAWRFPTLEPALSFQRQIQDRQ